MYSLDFAAQVSRICMDEIRRRGLRERKILRKSVPNSVLLLKVFRKQNCTADDLTHVSIHSVATLMQDTLWCCQERIVPKKVWRVINYETCTLNDLSRFISKRGENLLVEILDFLVQVMRHKEENQMDAYHLGEAMGKVTLGPADCDPIIAEKAGHFLTRMIIEHSKTIHGEKQLLFRVDSGFAWPTITTKKPMSKSEAARAKAKSYNRLIKKIRKRNFDPLNNANIALYSLLEDDYQQDPPASQEPYLSIFSKRLEPSDAILSPVLFRLVTEASKAIEPIPQDPFANSYLFKSKSVIENQVRIAFDDFMPLIQATTPRYMDHNSSYLNEKTSVPNSSNKSHLKLINNSISNMKINLRKHKSQGGMPQPVACTIIQEEQEEQPQQRLPATVTPTPPIVYQKQPRHEDIITSTLDQDTLLYTSEYSATTTTAASSNHSNSKQSKQHQVKSMMKRVIKIGTIVPMKKTTIY